MRFDWRNMGPGMCSPVTIWLCNLVPSRSDMYIHLISCVIFCCSRNGIFNEEIVFSRLLDFGAKNFLANSSWDGSILMRSH